MSYRTATWSGLGIAGCGLVFSLVAANAEPAYGGPMTGLGSALLMLAGFAMIGLGAFVALGAYALSRWAAARLEPQDGGDRGAEA